MASKAANLKYRFSITLEQWEAMYARQGGCCAMCGRKVSKTAAQTDHDHACCPGPRSCGKCVRGLLCHDCNRIVLGRVLQETAKGTVYALAVLQNMKNYLRNPSRVAEDDSHTVTSDS